MATIGSLAINVLARTGAFSRGMGKVRGDLRGFSKLGRGLNLALGPVGAGLAAVGAAGFTVSKGFQTAASFQNKMANSLAIMGDVSGETRDAMVKAAKDVAFTSKFSASDAADAFFFLASAGLSAEESIGALPKTAQFAQAGAFDLATATDLLTDAQSALGLSTGDVAEKMKNMTRVSDVLVKANTISNAKVEEFSRSLTNKAGAALREVGKDIEEGVAVLAAFADQGLKGAEAGTALSIVMRDLQTKALNNAEAFKAAGIRVFDSQNEMRNIGAIVADLEGKLGGLSDATRKQTLLQLGFTDKSVSFIQSLLGMSEKIAGYEMALRNAGGTTKEVADKQLTPFAKTMNKLKALFESLSIDVLGPALDALGSVLTPLLDDLRGIGDNADVANVFRDAFRDAALAAAGFLDNLGGIEETLLRLKVARKGATNLLDFAFKGPEAGVQSALEAANALRRADELARRRETGETFVARTRALFDRAANNAVKRSPFGDMVGTVRGLTDKAAGFAKGLFDKVKMRLDELEKLATTQKPMPEPALAGGRGGVPFLGLGLLGEQMKLLEKSQEIMPTRNQLALRGSSEAVSAIQQFRFRGAGKESVDKEQLNVAKKANEILRKVNTGIEDLRDNLKVVA